jgi:hypothetical protein
MLAIVGGAEALDGVDVSSHPEFLNDIGDLLFALPCYIGTRNARRGMRGAIGHIGNGRRRIRSLGRHAENVNEADDSSWERYARPFHHVLRFGRLLDSKLPMNRPEMPPCRQQ